MNADRPSRPLWVGDYIRWWGGTDWEWIFCVKCGRRLTTAKAKRDGFGRDCAADVSAAMIEQAQRAEHEACRLAQAVHHRAQTDKIARGAHTRRTSSARPSVDDATRLERDRRPSHSSRAELSVTQFRRAICSASRRRWARPARDPTGMDVACVHRQLITALVQLVAGVALHALPRDCVGRHCLQQIAPEILVLDGFRPALPAVALPLDQPPLQERIRQVRRVDENGHGCRTRERPQPL